jgi:hypothetical protein
MSTQSFASIQSGTGGHIADQDAASQERADLLAALATQRHFLRFTVRGLDDAQARQRTTVSELTLGGLIKHVTRGEQQWVAFILDQPGAIAAADSTSFDEHARGFVLTDGETLADLLARYDEVAAHTDEVAATVDLNLARPLPPAPWFEPGAHWTARRVFWHIVGETAQHAGHADIIRESLDGAKSMG